MRGGASAMSGTLHILLDPYELHQSLPVADVPMLGPSWLSDSKCA